ncbi:MAG: glycerophosphodiester phosphodiesterase [Spirochaetaceae bacterium]
MTPLDLPGSKPLVIAHRGFAAEYPENTMAAFTAAVEAGSLGIELDIHRLATGEAVVYHDFDLRRLHGEPRPILSLTRAELETYRIPLLEELFRTFGRRVFYDIEIKSRSRRTTGVEAEAIRLVRESGLEQKVLISSFNPHALREAAALAPEIPRGTIYSPDREVPHLLRRGWGRLLVPVAALKPRHDLVTRRYMARFSRRYAILPWTVDDPREALRLKELGVDGIITNNPRLICEALEAGRP